MAPEGAPGEAGQDCLTLSVASAHSACSRWPSLAFLTANAAAAAARARMTSLFTGFLSTACDGRLYQPEPAGRAGLNTSAVRSRDGKRVGLRGLEPLTSSLSGKRSNRLSYRPGEGCCGPALWPDRSVRLPHSDD